MPTHFLATPLGKKKATLAVMAGEDLPEVNTRNIIKPRIDQLPEDLCQMLEERKKQHDEEDLQAVHASIEADRQGTGTKVKDIAFTFITSTYASTKVTSLSSFWAHNAFSL